MRVLAVDPGNALGWATNQTGRLEWGTEDFHVRRGESSGMRWLRFGRWLQSATAPEFNPTGDDLRAMADDELVNAACRPRFQRKVDLIVYEVAHFMPKARAAAEIAAGFTTRLEEHAERHDIPLHPVPVQTLKAFALPAVKRKKGVPKMDRGKAAMIGAARARLDVPIHAGGSALGTNAHPVTVITPERGPDFIHLTEHEADALWLLWYAQAHIVGKEVA